MNAVNTQGNQTRRRKELVHIHAVNIYFKGDTLEGGVVLGLLSKILDIGTSFETFRDKLKGYVQRKFDNAKYVIYVVTYMKDPMKCFEESIVKEDLDEQEANSISKKKRLELSLTRYMDRE